ncbi:helix-turn-helix domain-containing protein [Candidatus Woesearchaeota archaeon]|nr:helix-turn-helix domain-containing protein [Candidatus Woesearchaeota archaeon]
MSKESFLLVSLKESKAKELAQVISNQSCRKILDYLAEKEATETELAKKLELPLSTVHYNLKHLLEAGLISAEEFHYSEKGKEVNHYKLANKYVIIAPKSTFGLKEKLKSILPVAVVISVTAGIIHLFSSQMSTFGAARLEKAVMETAAEPPIQAVQTQPNIALWFLIGALTALVIFLIIDYIKKKK